ncbi:hypothetical protein O9992_16355 [Vibrio lentus]|nr:hypothetical protein [Vibrio lentus]
MSGSVTLALSTESNYFLIHKSRYFATLNQIDLYLYYCEKKVTHGHKLIVMKMVTL